MKNEYWEQVKDIFQSALDRPAIERGQFLIDACGSDDDLRKEVLRLLASFDDADDFMEKAAIGEVADLVVGKAEKIKAGQTIGRYLIKKQIGAGGMGEVFLAKDTQLERLVALKVLSAAVAENGERMRRFMLEARAASALNHPNILTIYEIGNFENSHFIVTEFIEGETLREKIKREKLSLSELLDIAAQIAAALNAAHNAGIIHRDIKPENVMIREDGIVKVLDFGLAKLVEKTAETLDTEGETRHLFNTAPGLIMGTVSYMSPEQSRGKSTDQRTDIWSFGIVLYEMLTGQQPFTGETASDKIASILKSDFPPLVENVPDDIKRIIEKTLQKNSFERYQNSKDLLFDIQNLRRNPEFEDGISREQSSFSVEKKYNTPLNITADGKAKETIISETQYLSGAEQNVVKVPKSRFVLIAAFVFFIAALSVGGYFLYKAFYSSAITSVAVLPFVNESGDANLDYLADGVSERLIDGLSELSQLKVIARSSSFKYRGQDQNLTEIADALGVQAIVVGRVILRGNALTVRAELIDVRHDKQLWSSQYTRQTSDLQMVQENIVQNITENLRLKLSGEQEQKLAKHITQNPVAYQLYLNGLFYHRKGGRENTKKALDYYNQAIALDPNFALAYTQAAGVYNGFGGSGALNPKEAIPKAESMAQKALELDPALAEAHSVLAVIKRIKWDWAGTENELRQAIELNPNLAAAHSNYAIYLSVSGRSAEALEQIRRARELDPLWIGFQIAEGGILEWARQYDDAVRLLKNVAAENPDSGGAQEYLGYAYIAKGDYEEAINAFQKFYQIEGNSVTDKAFLGFAYAKSGRRNEALAILDELKNTKEYVSPAELAILYAGLDDKDAALAALEKAYNARDLQLQFIGVDPAYDSLRSDSRFQDLVRRVGLMR